MCCEDVLFMTWFRHSCPPPLSPCPIPLPYQSGETRCILEEPVDWADGFFVVYNISDRTSFLNAKNILQQIREARVEGCKGWVTVTSSTGLRWRGIGLWWIHGSHFWNECVGYQSRISVARTSLSGTHITHMVLYNITVQGMETIEQVQNEHKKRWPLMTILPLTRW